MRMPRFRIRPMMFLVAIMAVVLGTLSSSARMWWLAEFHRREAIRISLEKGSDHRRDVMIPWHIRMEYKYRDAIFSPWFGVEVEPRPP